MTARIAERCQKEMCEDKNRKSWLIVFEYFVLMTDLGLIMVKGKIYGRMFGDMAQNR